MESENTRKVFVLGNGKNYLTMHPVHTKNESGDPGSLFWKSAIYDQHLNIISWFGQGYGDKFDHEPTEEEICQCIVQQFHLPAMTGAMSSERFDEWMTELLRSPAAAIDHEDALITLLRLRDEGRISAAEYERLRDAVADIPTVEETDLAMNVLWAEFMETDAKAGCDCLCSPFLGFEAGTPLETVLAWFDSHSRKGLKELTDHYEFTKMFMHSFAVEKDKAPK